MRAVGLVHAVLAHEMNKVRGCLAGDGDERAKIHQQAAVAVEHDDALVGPPQREAQRRRRGLPHRADRIICQRMVGPERAPFLRRLIDRHDDLVAHVAGEDAEGEVASHHG